MSVAVCNGFDFLGFGTVKGDVIYFDLESSKRRPLNRILDMYSTLDISGLHLVTADSNVRRLFNGFEEDLQNLLFTYPNTRLVIIDVFQRILPVISKDNLYSSDYTNINGLNAIASKYAISILIIHHTRKHHLGPRATCMTFHLAKRNAHPSHPVATSARLDSDSRRRSRRAAGTIHQACAQHRPRDNGGRRQPAYRAQGNNRNRESRATDDDLPSHVHVRFLFSCVHTS